MNFEWFFYKKQFGKIVRKSKILRTIVLVTQNTIFFGIIVSIITFSIGFGFKEIIKKKLLNIQGQITITNLKIDNSIILNKSFFKDLFFFKFIRRINHFYEKDVIICDNKSQNVEKFIFKGISKDYNPIFFQNFLVIGYLEKVKKKLFSDYGILLSKKVSISLGLNIGSSIIVNFFFYKNGNPFFISKKFYVCGLYDTSIPEFDDVYIIGNIKHIQYFHKNSNVNNNQNEDFLEGVEIFLSDISFDKIISIKKKIDQKYSDNFLVKTIYDQSYKKIIEWIKIFDINIFVINIIVIITVFFNVIVFFLILIIERIKTIGILKTLGARNKVIHKIFLYYIIKILVPPLIIGNSIGIIFLFLQNKFRFLSLNKIQYYVDFVPVYLNINYILFINLSIFLICFSTVFFSSWFIINKIPPINSIEFE
ncbi:ABC transporter permease [Blattabacterium sp. (Cryptocercus punctulatus) str. Cpu]|uniref:ABC transporter permease n=1 Tax=Blattabacterium sp. (Cryptocercus punctulatus) str. Cpu TaxID=1075399 RepID=UPI000238727E|nr:FtsX-like permease family protein [Blattabacterium sp. (Cryptocercus punctulatus) str. Cpu]AEU09209.1 lipoprotein releasing system transmembrane protein [Blattabacterium sp. (Cryptocercus punctulatus) str. Cpu]